MIARILVALLLLFLTAAANADQQFDIVTPEWVAAHAKDPSVRILDVRTEVGEYFPGHVPNAVHLADTTMRGPRAGVPVMYLPVRTQAQLLARAGVWDGQTVVVYSDGENSTGATMIAYVLVRMGYPNVRIMDGGWSAYKATQQPTLNYPNYKQGRLTTKEAKTYVSIREVVQAAGKQGVKLVDARSAEQYEGRGLQMMRMGHIPGAISIPWESVMDPANKHKFKTRAEMQAIYDSKGLAKTDRIIIYCATSRDATLHYAVLKHLLGYPNVLLYEGSWTEYVAHPELPVKTGPDP